jgi:N-acetylneuraminic acid mutarotase
MGGSSTVSVAGSEQPGVYGTLGTPATGNIPTGRYSASSWTDSSGNFWLFGGQFNNRQSDVTQLNYLNDLWKFNPSTNEWVWMGGSSTIPVGPCTSIYSNNLVYCGQPGVYGSLGEFAAGNAPGGRYQAVSMIDKYGNFWLFGGEGFDASGNWGELNDVWEFNPSTNQWAWMGGSNLVPVRDGCTDCVYGRPGVYGTLGTPASGNVPGGRQGAASWTDNSGNFWLFGGGGFDANDNYSYLNDLWEFNPSTKEWAWMGGSSTILSPGISQPGVYGTLGNFAPGNVPGGRGFAANWTDSSGNFWLFGGNITGDSSALNLNDLWEFNPTTKEWAWMGGSSTVDQSGIYGTMGTPAAGNFPGSRELASTRTDANGNLWLFGGWGYDVNGNYLFLNDLWIFNPFTLEWTWSGGSSTGDQLGVYGTLGTPAPGNVPGARGGATSWTDNSGNFWLFAGWGDDSITGDSYLNDLWVYQPVHSIPAAATPTFSPPAGTYAAAQTVTISDTTPGAVIYYTTNGTAPTTGSARCTDSITVSSSETIEAIATATGYANSLIATAVYTITSPVAATPNFSPPAGTYATTQTVTIGDTTPGAVIYYTTNGTTPSTSSSVYGNPIVVSSSETLEAIAAATGYSASVVATAVYTIAVPTNTTLSVSATTLTYGQPLLLTGAVTAASGGTPGGTVTFYNSTTSMGSASLNGGGVATLSLTPAVGSYSITASYGGSSSDYASVSSPPIAVTVSPAPTTAVLTASPNPAPFGANVTFTATVGISTVVPIVSPAVTPTGTVSFYDGTTLLATENIASGVATYSTSALSVGSHNITADFAANPDFNASPSNLVVEVINPADFSISASPGSQSVYTGEAATYTVTITPGTGFDLPVALSCTQLPANTSCSFSPATVNGGAWNSTLVVQTAPPSPVTTASALSAKLRVTALAGFFLLIIPRRLRRYRKSWPLFLVILAILAAGTAITACSAPGPLAGGTPLGAQTIAVTGTATNGSQTLTHTANATLNVNSLF